MNLSQMRHRNGGRSATLTTHQGYSFSHREPDEAPPTASQTFRWVTESYSKEMWDVVTKDFHKRSANGEIFNNPKRSVETTFKQNKAIITGTMFYYARSDGALLSCWYVDMPAYTSPEACAARRTLTVPGRVESTAITSAYAGVTANTQNAVLWAGEARETVKMLTDIGAGLLALYQRTKKQRLAWVKGKLTVAEAQSLTLSLLYGILPLEQSIAQVTEGLFKLKSDGRKTSRGFNVYTDTNSDTWTSEVSTGEYTQGKYDTRFTLHETLEVSVRAGVLYDTDVSEFPALAVIADPKQVVETAYALARLSFVIDWFINVGSTLKAWSPSVGTNVLAAWVSVTETYTQRYEEVRDDYPRHDSIATGQGGFTANLAAEYTTKVVTRRPIDRSDLAILPRLDINLNFSKLNSLVLLFAKTKQK